MKLKILFLISVVCLATIYSSAQENSASLPFEFSVSVKEPKISFNARSILVDIKVTNNSPLTVDTKKMSAIALNLSKTLDRKAIEKTETAYFRLEPKVLNTGESFETQIDLNKLSWQENLNSSFFDVNKKTEYKPLLWGTYFLSVAIENCGKISPENRLLTDGSSNEASNPLKDLPLNRPCESNKILVNFLKPARSR